MAAVVKGQYENTLLDFLGYTFRRWLCKSRKQNSLFVNFTLADSKEAQKSTLLASSLSSFAEPPVRGSANDEQDVLVVV